MTMENGSYTNIKERLKDICFFCIQIVHTVIHVLTIALPSILTKVQDVHCQQFHKTGTRLDPHRKKSVGFSDNVQCKTILESDAEGYTEMLSTLSLNDLGNTSTKSTRRISYAYIPHSSDCDVKPSLESSLTDITETGSEKNALAPSANSDLTMNLLNDSVAGSANIVPEFIDADTRHSCFNESTITQRGRKDSLACFLNRKMKSTLRHPNPRTITLTNNSYTGNVNNELDDSESLRFKCQEIFNRDNLNSGFIEKHVASDAAMGERITVQRRTGIRRCSVMTMKPATDSRRTSASVQNRRRRFSGVKMDFLKSNISKSSRVPTFRPGNTTESFSHQRRSCDHRRSPFCLREMSTNQRISVPRKESMDRKLSISRRQSHARRQSVLLRRQSIKHVTGSQYFWNKVKQIRFVPQKIAEFKELFSQNAHNVLLSKYETNGPVYEITALGKKMVFLFEYSHLHELRKAEGTYPEHVDFKHLRTYRQKHGLPLGLLVGTGKDWARQRKILSKAIGGTLAMKKYSPTVEKVAKEVVQYIDRTYCKTGSVFETGSITGNYAAEAFGQVMYGMELGCLHRKPSADMHRFVGMVKNNFQDAKVLMALPSWLYPCSSAWRNHSNRWDFLLQTTENNIKKSKETISPLHKISIASTLTQTGAMTDPEIRINFTDLMTASVDTTSNVLQWCLYEIGKNRSIQDKIIQDVNACVNKSGHVIPDRLVYLQAVVKETLRLYPVGFFTSRVTQKDLKICGHFIQAKTHVAVSMYVLGRDKVLFPEPEVFNPERWLRGDSRLDKFFREVPFGFGPRMCLGRRVAELIIYQFIAHFCLELEFDTVDTSIKPSVRLLLVPSKPVELHVRPRMPNSAAPQRRKSLIHRLFRN